MQQYLQKLAHMRRLVRRMMLLVMLTLLAAFGLLFVSRVAALALCVCACLIRLLMIRRLIRSYRRAYQRACAEYGPGASLKDVRYCFSESLDASILCKQRLIPAGEPIKGTLFRHVLHGMQGQAEVVWGELSASFKLPDKGRNYLFVSGTLVCFHLPKPAAEDYVLLSRGLFDERFFSWQYEQLGLASAPFTQERLNRNSIAFVGGGSGNGKVPERFEKYWRELLEFCGGNAALSISQDKMLLLLRNRFYAPVPPLAQEITRDDLRRGDCPEVKHILRAPLLFT